MPTLASIGAVVELDAPESVQIDGELPDALAEGLEVERGLAASPPRRRCRPRARRSSTTQAGMPGEHDEDADEHEQAT